MVDPRTLQRSTRTDFSVETRAKTILHGHAFVRALPFTSLSPLVKSRDQFR